MTPKTRPLFNVAQAIRQRPGFGYGLGVLLVSILFAVRFLLDDILPPASLPYSIFLPAIFITTFLGGLGPGVVSAVLAGLAAWFWFLPPHGTFAVTMPAVIGLLFYGITVAIIIASVHMLNAAVARLRREQAHSADLLKRERELADQQRVMFQELQHRVANNMAFVGSLLNLYRRRVVKDPTSAVAALDEAVSRVETISRIHRRLYDPASVNLPVGQYLQELCSDVLETSGAKNIVCLVDAPAISLDVHKLLTLSLIVTEVVTNSLKYAFAPGEKGTISLTLAQLDPDQLALTIRDGGKGLPLDFDPASSQSLGMRIVKALAAQLQGDISFTSDNGTVARVTFPA